MTTLRIVLRAVIVALHTCPTRAITRVIHGIRRIPESTVEASPSFAHLRPSPPSPLRPPLRVGSRPRLSRFAASGRRPRAWRFRAVLWQDSQLIDGRTFRDGGRAEARSLAFAAFRLPLSPIPEEDQLGERGHDSRTAPNPPRTPDRPGPARRTGVARSTQGRATRGAGRGERGG